MEKQPTVAAVIVAGGSSQRMGFDKLFYPVAGVEVLRLAVASMDINPSITSLVVVAGQNLPKIEALFAAYPPAKPIRIVRGGDTRTASVQAGVFAANDADFVAIHDGARPFVPQQVINTTVQAAFECGAAAPALPVKDTVKQERDGWVQKTVPRAALRAVQTPQVFRRRDFLAALAAIVPEEYPTFTDDCLVMECAGYPVRLVEGSEKNYKITTIQDLPKEEPTMRIGHGYDVHRLVEGRALIIGGVTIPYEKGLLGHSDADVLLHAVTDALLGAAALGDIGAHFPDTAPEYKGADSLTLLRIAAEKVSAIGLQAANVDATLLCQAPKMAPHIPAMRRNIAGALGLAVDAVSVKATTEEGLGFTGAGEGIAAHCVLLLQTLPQGV